MIEINTTNHKSDDYGESIISKGDAIMINEKYITLVSKSFNQCHTTIEMRDGNIVKAWQTYEEIKELISYPKEIDVFNGIEF